MSSVNIVANVGIPDAAINNNTSLRSEPSTAAFFDELYVTGNWFASRSNDGGSTWMFVDPFTALPAAAAGFCCDQLVAHETSRNLWFWYLQYSQAAATTNVVRLAVSTSGKPDTWRYWDFTPTMFNSSLPADSWFDYPDIAFTNNQLYLTSNVYDIAETWLQSLVLRIPLDTFIANNVTYQYYNIGDHGSLKLVRGAADEMFFASHNYGNPIRIHRWGDGANANMTWVDVNASPWNAQHALSNPPQPYSSPCPDGNEWLTGSDPRITAGWRINNTVGFAWTANSDANHPHPYIKTLVVNTDDNSVVAQPDLWSAALAYAYPAMCPAPDNRVGITAFFGGGGIEYPVHMVGFLETDQWVLARAATSTHSPNMAAWGDYVSCSLLDPEHQQWVASGYTLQGGQAQTDVEPRFVRFAVGP